jgi:hypothetical protein
MKKLIKEASESTLKSAIMNTPDAERKKFGQLLKDCAKELGYEYQFRKLKGAGVILSVFVVGGLILDIPWVTLQGIIPAVGIAIIDAKMMKEIYECARSKRKMEKTMQESKKVIRLTESELVGLVKQVIKEQTDERDLIRGVQRFLNEKFKLNLEVDGKTGPNSDTEKAIMKYQGLIKCYPTDGVWGPNTWEKMSGPDRKRLKELVAEEGGILDQLMNKLGF